MRILGVFVALGVFGCAAPGEELEAMSLSAEAPAFEHCLSGGVPGGLDTVSWRHFSNWFVTSGTPWHSAQDVLAQEGKATTLPAKFSYGAFSKDLEDEWIQVFLNNCDGGYRYLGAALTDDDGRIHMKLPASKLPPVGHHRLLFRVAGDDTWTYSSLRVYPAGTSFVVFDIDKTLTAGDSEIVNQTVSEILGGDYSPEPRHGALDIAWARYESQRYEVLYLTGRPYLLTSLSREWLWERGFPSGTLHVVDDVSNSWPSDSKVGKYKRNYLKWVKSQGFSLKAAYGDTDTDITAYEAAGIPKAQTFIVGTNGGQDGTVDLGESYTQHAENVASEPGPNQPFVR